MQTNQYVKSLLELVHMQIFSSIAFLIGKIHFCSSSKENSSNPTMSFMFLAWCQNTNNKSLIYRYTTNSLTCIHKPCPLEEKFQTKTDPLEDEFCLIDHFLPKNSIYDPFDIMSMENKIHQSLTLPYISYHMQSNLIINNCSLDNITIRTTAVMDLCTKATWSNTDNLIEPPTLSWLSGNISDTHQDKMNLSICETYTYTLESNQKRNRVEVKSQTMFRPMEQYLQKQRRWSAVAWNFWVME